MSGVTLLLAHRSAMTRAGLRASVAGTAIDVVAEAATGPDALAACRLAPRLCLLDVDLPGGGIETAQAIGESCPAIRVVMLSERRDPVALLSALHAGAAGYLPMDMDPGRLAPTLLGVLAGEPAIPRDLVGAIIHELRRSSAHRRETFEQRAGVALSDREWQVAELLVEGHRTSTVAAKLDLSPVTVRRHVGALVARLGVPDRLAAVRMLGELSPR